jgi:phage prohead protease, HK97 family
MQDPALTEMGALPMAPFQRPPDSPPQALCIAGYATLWGVADLAGDVVAKGAFADSLAQAAVGHIKMLHQHGEALPVGVWDHLIEDETGLFVRGRILAWTPEGRLVQALVRAGALDGLSIGFRSRRAHREGRLRVLSQIDLWEVSLVTFPMLPGARLSVTGLGAF